MRPNRIHSATRLGESPGPRGFVVQLESVPGRLRTGPLGRRLSLLLPSRMMLSRNRCLQSNCVPLNPQFFDRDSRVRGNNRQYVSNNQGQLRAKIKISGKRDTP
jgi:hypothetical protein